MGLQVNTIGACTLVDVMTNSYTGVTSAVLKFKNIETNAVYSQNITYSGSPLRAHVQISTLDLPSENGPYEVSLEESNSEVARRSLLIHCDIDCCLTKLTNEIIDCHCDCPRCSTALARAQKVFLLLDSALSTVELTNTTQGQFNSGYYLDISEKYKKAKSICDNSCGCDC